MQAKVNAKGLRLGHARGGVLRKVKPLASEAGPPRAVSWTCLLVVRPLCHKGPDTVVGEGSRGVKHVLGARHCNRHVGEPRG